MDRVAALIDTEYGRMIVPAHDLNQTDALAGSFALTQRLNLRVHNVCLGNPDGGGGWIEVPQFDYRNALNFGSIEFGTDDQVAQLNQRREHDPARVEHVPLLPLDSFGFERIDVMKIDVQRMEVDLLRGAAETLKRCRPVLFVEWIGNDRTVLSREIESHGYRIEREVIDDWLCLPI